MNILKPIGTTQTLKIIPRNYIESVTVKLQRRNTKEITTFSVLSTFNDGYMEIDYIFDLVEGENYLFEVTNTVGTTKLLYRGQIFCTDQDSFTEQPYEMTKGDFVEAPDNNDIIIF